MLKKAGRKLKEKFNDLKLSGKITLANSVLLVMVMVGIMLFNNAITMRTAIKHTIENNTQKNDIIAQRVVHMLDNAEDMSALIVHNDNVQRRLQLENSIQRMMGAYTIRYILNNIVQNSSGISTIVIYRANGGMIASGRVNMEMLDEKDFKDTFVMMEDKWDEITWQDIHESNYYMFDSERSVVTLNRNVISLYTGEVIGMLTININETKLADTYSAQLSDSTDIFIVNEAGEIVSAQDKSMLMKKAETLVDYEAAEDNIVEQDGVKKLVTTFPIEKMGWSIVRMDLLDTLYAEKQQMTGTSYVIAIIAVVIAAFATKHIADALTGPIMKLSRMMDGPDDQMLYGELPDAGGNDEVGKLAQSFKRMQTRMQVLIERVRYEQQQHMKNEMLTLQTQINPHFLYNTLESVCSLIQLNRLEDASQMVKSIEIFYRGTLSKGSAIITLREEIGVTMQYIQIQKYRYDGNLQVCVDADPETEDCMIPKLTLQPLIENAIYHGLKNGGRDGLITIETKHDKDTVMIIVSDNGEGFDDADMENLETRQQDKKTSGYGIKNTISRIQSYAGKGYGIEIHSTKGVGTKVYVRIPNKKKDRE